MQKSHLLFILLSCIPIFCMETQEFEKFKKKILEKSPKSRKIWANQEIENFKKISPLLKEIIQQIKDIEKQLKNWQEVLDKENERSNGFILLGDDFFEQVKNEKNNLKIRLQNLEIKKQEFLCHKIKLKLAYEIIRETKESSE